MKAVIILQARLDSSRLPSKVLLPLAGKSVIEHILERLSLSKEADEVAVAVPEVEKDGKLSSLVNRLGYRVILGPEHDVLSRYIISAYETSAEIVVRATADNPLVEPSVIDKQIRFIRENPEIDYVFTRRLPLGVSTETFPRKTLEKLDYLAKAPLHREHVTYYLVENPDPFRIRFLQAPSELERPSYRLTLDTEEDYAVFKEIYGTLYNGKDIVSLEEVISLLDANPELAKMNSHVVQVPPHIEQVLASVVS